MYIIDLEEHGNGGVCSETILDTLPLEEALKKSPRNYGIRSKMWGFWPVICRTRNGNKPSYIWNEGTEQWEKAR